MRPDEEQWYSASYQSTPTLVCYRRRSAAEAAFVTPVVNRAQAELFGRAERTRVIIDS